MLHAYYVLLLNNCILHVYKFYLNVETNNINIYYKTKLNQYLTNYPDYLLFLILDFPMQSDHRTDTFQFVYNSTFLCIFLAQKAAL